MTKDVFDVFTNSFFGFDDLTKDIREILYDVEKQTFPPYNLIENEKNKFTLEFALAGWNLDEINVYQEGNTLIIQSSNYDDKPAIYGGTYDDVLQSYPKFRVQKISKRKFRTKFKLSELTDINNVYMENGLLIIELTTKPKKQEEIERIDFKISKK